MLKINALPHVHGILERAQTACATLNNKSISEDLLFHCFASNLSLTCSKALESVGVDLKKLWEESNKYLKFTPKAQHSSNYSKKAESIIRFAEQIAVEQFDQDYLSPEMLLLAFFSEEYMPKALRDCFQNEKIESSPRIKGVFERAVAIIKDKEEMLDEEPELLDSDDEEPSDWIPMFEENPILSKFAENLNIKAANGDFGKFVDFDNKVDEMATILCRKKKPNVILVGVSGSGKSSLVERLACTIVEGDVPDLLSNKVIYSVNLSSMVAGTQYRGQFEKRLEEFIKEAKKYSNLILFIDEIHTLVGAGGSSGNALEASNILKPELANGSISCIGATTINEYTETIKRDAALDRRFERVIVREPSKFKMKEILPQITSYYEDFHGVKYSDEFTENVVDFCEKFMPNRNYPDKAIDVIDHCGAQAKVKFWEMDQSVKDMQKTLMEKVEKNGKASQKEVDALNSKIEEWETKLLESNAEVGLEHLNSFFEAKGSPLNKLDVVSSLIKDLKEEIVGNNLLLNAFSQNLQHSTLRIGKKNHSTPDTFIISGQNSTGKTLFCETLKNSLERSGANVLLYNGTEFSDSYAPYKIVSPQRNNTSLAEKVLIHPNSVILIDDFEKVHCSCEGLFAQILKEGRLQMDNGDIADFSNCKILLFAASKNEKSMGFGEQDQNQAANISHIITNLATGKFSLHILNKKDLRRILYKRLKEIEKTVKLKGSKLVFDFKFLKGFVEKNGSGDFAAKTLNEAIEKELVPRISKLLLEKRAHITL